MFELECSSLLTRRKKKFDFFGTIEDAVNIAEKLEVKAISTFIVDQDGNVCRHTARSHCQLNDLSDHIASLIS